MIAAVTPVTDMTAIPVTMAKLSSLRMSRGNPRKKKAGKLSHAELVATIRTVGVLHPLLVWDRGDGMEVETGGRRLKALRTIHRGNEGEALVPVRVIPEGADLDAIRLAENFARASMDPIDEAEAMAQVADVEARGVKGCAKAFGVSVDHVRGRLKLAGLHPTIKKAVRAEMLSACAAEAFSAVPADRQAELFASCDGGGTITAHRVRGLIRMEWVNADPARFDLDTLPAGSVTHDLFGRQTLVRREVFLAAQRAALDAEAETLRGEGWNCVEVVGADDWGYPRNVRQINPKQIMTDPAAYEALVERYDALDWDEQDTPEGEALQDQIEALEAAATREYPKNARKDGTMFLLLSGDGTVDERVFRPLAEPAAARPGEAGVDAAEGDAVEAVPTSRMTSGQRTEVFMAECRAAREALANSGDEARKVRLVLLCLALHPGGHTTLTASRRETTLPGDEPDTHSRHASADPYAALMELSVEELDAYLHTLATTLPGFAGDRRDKLTARIAGDLGVTARSAWTPDAAWLKGYRRADLVALIGEVAPGVHAPEALAKSKHKDLAALAGEVLAGDTDAARRWLPAGLAG